MKIDLIQLSEIAIEAARSAGKIIQESMHAEVSVEQKEGGDSLASQVVTEVDRKCEAAILAMLQPTCKAYDLGLLSEETEDDSSRFEKDFFWCIDPMDGTLAFINQHPGFSVSIALLAKDGTPHIGVVYDPSRDITYHAIKGIGAFKNSTPWEINNTNDFFTYVTDRALADTPRVSEIEHMLQEIRQKLNLSGIKEMSGGGAVLNAIHVLENGPACMLKHPKEQPGGGSIWDYAATTCIYRELRLRATNFEGSPLLLNEKSSTFMNEQGVFFSNP